MGWAFQPLQQVCSPHTQGYSVANPLLPACSVHREMMVAAFACMTCTHQIVGGISTDHHNFATILAISIRVLSSLVLVLHSSTAGVTRRAQCIREGQNCACSLCALCCCSRH